MKYLRKIAVLIIIVVFIASVIIAMGAIFAIKNVNVNLVTYDYSLSKQLDGEEDSFTHNTINYDAEAYAEEIGRLKKPLQTFKGESILFVGRDDVEDALSGFDYTVVSYKKRYPCTIEVTLEQRLETFAIEVGGQYSKYDDKGNFLVTSEQNKNGIDGEPNVLLKGIPVERIVEFADYAAHFRNQFNALRSVVSQIELVENSEIPGFIDELIFSLRCGLKIEIDDYADRTFEKIEKSKSEYDLLSEKKKQSGVLHIFNEGTSIGASYEP